MHSLLVHFGLYLTVEGSSCDRPVVRTLCCGRNNPGSNPGHSDLFFLLPSLLLFTLQLQTAMSVSSSGVSGPSFDV